MTAAITPTQAQERKQGRIQAEVIECWNELIVANLVSGRATISQADAIRALTLCTGATRGEVFERKWLDIEPHFRASGWSVRYDKPAYYENYKATFYFETRKD
jgi:hypothetical protein